MSKLLAYIIKLSLVTAVFPNQLKNSLFVPVYKGGDKKQIIKSRPISLIFKILVS